MVVTIKGRHWTPGTAFRTFAAKRVQKLARIYPALIRAEITLTREGIRHQTELHVRGNGVDLLTKGADIDPRAGVEAVVEKAERALERRKDRLKDRKRRAGARGIGRAASTDDLPPLPKTGSSVTLVREAAKRPVLSADAAAATLLRGRKPFVVFTEPTGEVRVAYRRGEREVGILELD